MSMIKVRKVNVVPIRKIKKEKPDTDVPEDSVACKICSKVFVTEVALMNHARMDHIDQYMAGANFCMKPYAGNKRKFTEQEEEDIKAKTQQLISSMQPTQLSSLASKDVSYIIIKPDIQHFKLKKFKKVVEKVKPEKIVREKKEKEVKPISGPFECLQPSIHIPEALCHQMFLSCCEYSAHFRDEHTRRRKGNRCQVCEKPIAGTDQPMPYSCKVCGMGFENSKDLSEHSQTAHIKPKPFQCVMCQKRFTQQGGLHQHMRMHSGDRPFQCTYCPKAFTQKSGLDQHLRIHTKEKPYRCVICNKSFCQSVHLQQHMRTHTNVAPFQCGICQKRFKQSSHLNYHLKNHNMSMTEEQKERYVNLMQEMLKQGFITGTNEVSAEVTCDSNETVQMKEEIGEVACEEVAETYILGTTDEVWCESVVSEQ